MTAIRSNKVETNWLADQDGPLPNLMESLRLDNRLLVQQMLQLDPWQKPEDDDNLKYGPPEDDESTNPNPQNSDFPAVHWRQALVFADTSLQNVVLRQVLGDTGSWNSQTAATIKKKKKRNEPIAADEPPIPKNLGIVTTQVLENFNRNDFSAGTNSNSNASSDYSSGSYTRVKPTSFFDSEAEVVLSSFSSENLGGVSDTVELALLANSNQSQQQQQYEQQTPPPPALDVIVYFVRPDPAQVSSVADHIKRYHKIHLQQKTNQPLFHRLLFIPCYSSLCEQILVDKGVMSLSKSKSSGAHNTKNINIHPGPTDTISIHDLQLDLIPFDKDIISLEMTNVMKEAYIDQCPSSTITSLARSMMRLQDVIGTIPKIQGVGPLGEHLLSKMMRMRLEEYLWEKEEMETLQMNGTTLKNYLNGDVQDKTTCDVAGMIIIDRKVDIVTPMLSPLTYEGLVDEIIGIDSGFVTVDASLVLNEESNDADESVNTTNKEKVALALNGSDTLFAEVRNQNVEKFGSFLQNQAKALKESHSNFTNKDKDLTEIHQFVKQIPIFTKNLQSLTQQIQLAERVKQTTNESSFRSRWQTERAMLEGETCYDTLEDLIATREPPWRLLRLLVLQSITGGGLQTRKYDYLRREIIQTYGFEYMFILSNFEKMGLLRRQELSILSSSSPFPKLRQGLNLINSEVSTLEPEDIAYVSSGYAPLTVRLVQALVGGKSKEILKELPGRIVAVHQGEVPAEYNVSVQKSFSWNIPVDQVEKQKKKPVLLVLYMGGVTFMEIAALRFLSKSENFPFEIVCCTSKIFNGSTFLRSLS